jgi:type I restriction enzyme R subunit
MPLITEHSIEDFAIKLLEHLGYEYIYSKHLRTSNSFLDTMLPKLMSGEVRVSQTSVI